ncbi:hypothetical protein F8388_018846 [Cannabis sativa]|uniref:tRNA/rRNA methyltransferase SpoU type domain-containing protein n=1 Tax=Cannabis sativa TaxID=3483 RepID=A0A7J6I7K1_CANSA|nr:hypothetical protein F8388_018846 [Cannabis sativa]KAF4403584.1 hypothetical protein G4B88_002437 [Cannabis sativa]
MEATALKARGIAIAAAAAPLYSLCHFRTTVSPSLLRSLTSNPPRFHLSCSSPPLCSLGRGRTETTLPHGVEDNLTSEVSHYNILQVVLVSPQIPGNTGCIARTCAASAVGLHLVGPLGFQIDDAKLKRAGLDYWPFVVVKVHNSWEDFKLYFSQQEISYRRGDYLIFGSETRGLPNEALQDCKSEEFGGGTVKIPMVETYVRCLNLSVSVGIALYEASRQLNYEQLQFPVEDCSNSEQTFVTEDIFA